MTVTETAIYIWNLIKDFFNAEEVYILSVYIISHYLGQKFTEKRIFGFAYQYPFICVLKFTKVQVYVSNTIYYCFPPPH